MTTDFWQKTKVPHGWSCSCKSKCRVLSAKVIQTIAQQGSRHAFAAKPNPGLIRHGINHDPDAQIKPESGLKR